jgi:hypothetical protein
VPSATGAVVSALLGAEVLSGGGLGAVALAAVLVLVGRFADRPAWPERFGVAAGVVAVDAVVVSGVEAAGSGEILTRGVGAGTGALGAVVAAATGAALLARSPGV